MKISAVLLSFLFHTLFFDLTAEAQINENLQAAIETQLSYKSWDYLMQLETVDDVPGIGVGTGRSTIRHIADLDKNIQVLIVYSSVEDSNKEGDGRVTKKRLEASKTDQNITSRFRSDETSYETSESVFEVMNHLNIPDFRGFGLMNFPRKFSEAKSEQSTVMQLASLKAANAKYSSSIRKGVASITFAADMRPDNSGKSAGKLVDLFDIDLERFVSKGFYRKWVNRDGVARDLELQFCKWDELDGTPVPVDLQVYTDTFYAPEDRDIKKVVPYERVTLVQYHWLSVNADVTESISKIELSDKNKVLELIDSELLGATNFSKDNKK